MVQHDLDGARGDSGVGCAHTSESPLEPVIRCSNQLAHLAQADLERPAVNSGLKFPILPVENSPTPNLTDGFPWPRPERSPAPPSGGALWAERRPGSRKARPQDDPSPVPESATGRPSSGP